MVDFEFEFQYADGKAQVLRQTAGSIPAGRCVVLCGGSGCGKPTLLRCINGLIPQLYEGELKGFCRLNGQDTAGMSIGEIGELAAGLYKPSGGRIMLFGKPQNPKQLQKQVLFILQEAEFQFFTGSVLHELQYGHAVTPEFEAKTEALLKSMDMWGCRDRHPFSLSGGQMQRLALMMAYLSDKPIVILDEPTAGQDAESLERCAALIREMRKEKTVLIITHDLELIADACDYCIKLSDGRAETEFPVQSGQDLEAVRQYMERFHPSDIPAKKQHKERFHPVTKLLYWLTLLDGIVYFIIGTKVKKPGAILIYSIVRAIMGGYLPYIILFILSGVIAERLLWKMGYGNAKALTISYVINQVLAAFGSTIIPYVIAAKAMADQMVTDDRQDTILAASEMLQSRVSVALAAGVIVAAFIGAMIGKRIVKKHLAA